VFDVLDLYLWFSYRFIDIFPDGNLVRDIQKELDEIIQQGVFQITKLLQNSETAISSNRPDEDSFSISQRKVNVFKGERVSAKQNQVLKTFFFFSRNRFQVGSGPIERSSDWETPRARTLNAKHASRAEKRVGSLVADESSHNRRWRRRWPFTVQEISTKADEKVMKGYAEKLMKCSEEFVSKIASVIE
jgi:Mitochondrial degradasome RNA helicase subunit C terminal